MSQLSGLGIPRPHSACGYRDAVAPDMAQGGGTLPEKLPEALDAVRGWVEQRL